MADVTVDGETMTEDEFDHRLNVAYWQGKADSLGDVIGLANTKAGEHFAARREEQASNWRQVADWLAGLYRQAGETYDNLKNGVEDDECK